MIEILARARLDVAEPEAQTDLAAVVSPALLQETVARYFLVRLPREVDSQEEANRVQRCGQKRRELAERMLYCLYESADEWADPDLKELLYSPWQKAGKLTDEGFPAPLVSEAGLSISPAFVDAAGSEGRPAERAATVGAEAAPKEVAG